MLPDGLHRMLTPILAEHAGDPGPILHIDRLGGSFGATLYRLHTRQAGYALKWAHQPLPGALAAEADGLRRLAATGTVRIPQVIAVSGQDNPDTPAFLLSEWLDGNGSRPDMARLGAQLAALHRHGNDTYGLERDNYIGGTPQPNQPHPNWITFYREQRLQPQIDRADANGLLPTTRRHALEKVIANLDRRLGGVSRCPALIHGDLWGGNVIAADRHGTPAIIDPAVSYSDREAELAFTELFGGFSPRFYAAYDEVWPREPGYAERRDLYNLYHLLNHLNLFGEPYGLQVDAVARRYGG
jgi:fructosamine-3-kinase